ncbi:hypothetical protein GCM10027299_05260 [Larkinella ripae]
MTLEELRDRIKNEVVLYEGELADWQWRQKGLVDEASALGISDFTRLVNDISRQVNRDFGKILDLKKKIVTVALQRQKKLTDADLNQFITEAERVQLSRAFVTEQWIPAILSALPETETLSGNPAPTSPAEPVKLPQPPPVPATAPAVEPVDAVRRKIKNILDDYDKHIQAQSLNFLFKAVDYDEAALAEEIRRYLSEHYYASVHPPRGNTLKEKLISTDWRHLSWWEKDSPKTPEYVKTQTGYTTTPSVAVTDPPNRPAAGAWASPEKPPQTVPPPVQPPNTPQKSGLSDAALIGLAVLSALILIWVVLRLTRGDEEPEPTPKRSKNRTSQSVSPEALESRAASSKKKKQSTRGKETEGTRAHKTERRSADSGKNTRTQPESEEGDFDHVDETVGDFGLRPAQKGKFWGYIDKRNKWTIEPQFDLATPFNNGKASVEMDGNQFFIDRYGNRIRNSN